jgi:hypothetical protein
LAETEGDASHRDLGFDWDLKSTDIHQFDDVLQNLNDDNSSIWQLVEEHKFYI